MMVHLSIVLPALNERKNLEVLLPQIERLFNGKSFEILVIDYHSLDGTEKLCNKLNKIYKNVRVIQRLKKALGAALMQGYSSAKGDVIISSDSDLSFSTRDMQRLLEGIDGGYDIVLGSRYYKDGSYETKRASTILKYFFSKVGNYVITKAFNLHIHDFSANFRAFNKSILDGLKLESNDNAILFEMVIKANANGLKIKEIPVEFKERKYGKSNLKLFREVFKFILKVVKFYYKINLSRNKL